MIYQHLLFTLSFSLNKKKKILKRDLPVEEQTSILAKVRINILDFFEYYCDFVKNYIKLAKSIVLLI